jgi:hypothetical protein
MNSVYLHILMICLALFVYAVPAYAYIDPGTGSVMLQAVVAGLFAAIFFVKLSWRKFTSFFSKRRSVLR